MFSPEDGDGILCFSEKSVSACESAGHRNPEEHHRHLHCSDKLSFFLHG
jgi:hypothetical protein